MVKTNKSRQHKKLYTKIEDKKILDFYVLI